MVSFGYSDDNIYIWDLQTGELKVELEGHTAHVLSIAFSPNGKYLASAGWDKDINIWDFESGSLLKVLTGHREAVGTIKYSPDGRRIVSVTHFSQKEKSCRLWNTETGSELAVVESDSINITNAIFGFSGKCFAYGEKNQKTYLWDIEAQKMWVSHDTSLAKDIELSNWSFKNIRDISFDKVTKDENSTLSFPKNHYLFHEIHNGERSRVKIEPITNSKVFLDLLNSKDLGAFTFNNEENLIAAKMDNKIHLWRSNATEKIAVLNGHVDEINSLAFSPDSKYLASCAQDGSIRLWDVEKSASVAKLEGHKYNITSVAFSSNDKYMASGSADGSIRIWDVESGKEIQVLIPKFNGDINSIAFNSTGNLIAVGGGYSRYGISENYLGIWNVETGKETLVLSGHEDGINSVAFSPNGKYLASASKDRTIRLWEVESGKQSKVMPGHKNVIYCISFSSSGKLLISGSADTYVGIWNIESGLPVAALEEHKGSVKSVAISKNDKYLISCAQDSSLMIYDLEADQYTIKRGLIPISSVAISPDEESYAIGFVDGDITIDNINFRVNKSNDSKVTLSRHTEAVTGLAFNSDGSRLVSASKDGTMRLWNIAKDTTLLNLTTSEGVFKNVEYSQKKSRLFAWGNDKLDSGLGETRVLINAEGEFESYYGGKTEDERFKGINFNLQTWNLSSGAKTDIKFDSRRTRRSEELLRSFGPGLYRKPPPFSFADCAKLSIDEELIAVGLKDGSIRLLDSDSNEEVSYFHEYLGYIRNIAFSNSGDLLAYTLDDMIRIWNIRNKSLVDTLALHNKRESDTHAHEILSLDFSPDDELLAFGGEDKRLYIWNMKDKKTSEYLGHQGDIVLVAFNPVGNLLATAATDNTIRLWDVRTGIVEHILSGHSRYIKSLSFSSDGKYLISASLDGSFRLWLVSTGEEIIAFTGHNYSPVIYAAFLETDKTLVSITQDYKIRYQDLSYLQYLDLDHRSEFFDKLLRASCYLLQYSLNDSRLKFELCRPYLTPINNYRFPKEREFWKLDRPRPVNKDPVMWLVENLQKNR